MTNKRIHEQNGGDHDIKKKKKASPVLTFHNVWY